MRSRPTRTPAPASSPVVLTMLFMHSTAGLGYSSAIVVVLCSFAVTLSTLSRHQPATKTCMSPRMRVDRGLRRPAGAVTYPPSLLFLPSRPPATAAGAESSRGPRVDSPGSHHFSGSSR